MMISLQHISFCFNKNCMEKLQALLHQGMAIRFEDCMQPVVYISVSYKCLTMTNNCRECEIQFLCSQLKGSNVKANREKYI